MAWKLCDDYDGSTDDVQPVPIGYNGQIFLPHMGPESRKRYEEAMAPWIADQPSHRPMPTITDSGPEGTKPVTVRSPATQGKQRRPVRADVAEIRAWALANGKVVAAAGRLPHELIAEYDARVQ